MAEWIISFFPAHHCYIEPFGGSAAVLLNKPVSDVEIYNDLDGRIVELMDYIKEAPDRLFEEVYNMPYGRPVFQKLKKELIKDAKSGGLEPFERATRFFYIKNVVYGGFERGGPRISKVINEATKYYQRCLGIFNISDRLRNVTLEKLDFREIFKRYDGTEVLFYIDPPYYGIDQYGISFKEQDHIDLAAILQKIKAKTIVSYYVLPEIMAMYPGWHVEKRYFVKGSVTSKMEDENFKPKEKGAEILLMNFKPELILF